MNYKAKRQIWTTYWLYVCRSKSVTARLDCGLRLTLYVGRVFNDSNAEAACGILALSFYCAIKQPKHTTYNTCDNKFRQKTHLETVAS